MGLSGIFQSGCRREPMIDVSDFNRLGCHTAILKKCSNMVNYDGLHAAKMKYRKFQAEPAKKQMPTAEPGNDNLCCILSAKACNCHIVTAPFRPWYSFRMVVLFFLRPMAVRAQHFPCGPSRPCSAGCVVRIGRKPGIKCSKAGFEELMNDVDSATQTRDVKGHVFVEVSSAASLGDLFLSA